jgi:hypothetical protein
MQEHRLQNEGDIRGGWHHNTVAAEGLRTDFTGGESGRLVG